MGKVRVLLRRGAKEPGTPAPSPTATAVCHAPFSGLWFLPSGAVRACCVSDGYDLGNITTDRLRDIWHGARVAALRQAVLHGDYSLGCQHCEHRKDAGLDPITRHYDHLATDTLAPAYPQKVMLSLSNSCNLRCIQCNSELSSSHRIAEGLPALPKVYREQFFEDFAEFVPHLKELQFMGGEPFLVTEYHRIWDMLAAENPDVECYLTTNGTQWNRRVERALDQLRFNLEVSLDGATRETFERVRVGADHATVMRNVERFAAYARERGTSLEIYHCLMPQNYDEFGQLLLYADDLDVHVQVSIVESPRHCSLESIEDWDDVRRSFQRQAEEIRPRLRRNGWVFDNQYHRVMEAGLVRARTVSAAAPPSVRGDARQA